MLAVISSGTDHGKEKLDCEVLKMQTYLDLRIYYNYVACGWYKRRLYLVPTLKDQLPSSLDSRLTLFYLAVSFLAARLHY